MFYRPPACCRSVPACQPMAPWLLADEDQSIAEGLTDDAETPLECERRLLRPDRDRPPDDVTAEFEGDRPAGSAADVAWRPAGREARAEASRHDLHRG